MDRCARVSFARLENEASTASQCDRKHPHWNHGRKLKGVIPRRYPGFRKEKLSLPSRPGPSNRLEKLRIPQANPRLQDHDELSSCIRNSLAMFSRMIRVKPLCSRSTDSSNRKIRARRRGAVALQEGNCASAALTARPLHRFEARDESRDLPGRWTLDGRFRSAWPVIVLPPIQCG